MIVVYCSDNPTANININYVSRYKPLLGHQLSPRPLRTHAALVEVQPQPCPLRQLQPPSQEVGSSQRQSGGCQGEHDPGRNHGLHGGRTLRLCSRMLLGGPDPQVHGHTYLDNCEWGILLVHSRLRLDDPDSSSPS